MKDESKTIIAISTGIALSAAITFGINISNVGARDLVFKDDTKVYYDIYEYADAKDIYALTKGNEMVLCYRDIYYDKVKLTDVLGIDPLRLHGYYSLDNKELVCVEGMEDLLGYHIQPLKKIVDYSKIKPNSEGVLYTEILSAINDINVKKR